jgi:hypothetical protein
MPLSLANRGGNRQRQAAATVFSATTRISSASRAVSAENYLHFHRVVIVSVFDSAATGRGHLQSLIGARWTAPDTEGAGVWLVAA